MGGSRLDDDDREPSLVRPYLITGGETRATAADLPIEAVVTTADGVDAGQLGFERREIAELCADPTSIAEVASLLDLPLGVARFLVSDLAEHGYLRSNGVASSHDTELIERLIEGIRAL